MANINITKIGSDFVIENASGKLELTWADLYELVKYFNYDYALKEVEEYVTEFDDESSINAFGKNIGSIIGDKSLMEKIAKRLIENRINNETTDEIYNAIREGIIND